MVRLEQFGVAIVVFSMFVLLGASLLLESNDNYDLDSDESLFHRGLTNSSESIRNTAENLRNDTQLGETTDQTTEGELYKDAIPSTLRIWDTVKITENVLDSAIDDTHLLPVGLKDGFFAIFGLLASAFGIYMIFRFKPQKD